MSTQSEMPRYKCHKEVWALKIRSIDILDDGAFLYVFAPGQVPVFVDNDYLQKHKPMQGGYFVVYEDGYKSFSPSEAFESGYTLIR